MIWPNNTRAESDSASSANGNLPGELVAERQLADELYAALQFRDGPDWQRGIRYPLIEEALALWKARRLRSCPRTLWQSPFR